MAFSQRVQALPPELFDYIKELVFAFNLVPPRVKIDRRYKPPFQLHIDKATRSKFAQVCYSQTTFTFDQPAIFFKWLGSVQNNHLDMIGDTELQVQTPRNQEYPKRFMESSMWHRHVVLNLIALRRDASIILGCDIPFPNPRMVLVQSYRAATPSEWSIDGVGLEWEWDEELMYEHERLSHRSRRIW